MVKKSNSNNSKGNWKGAKIPTILKPWLKTLILGKKNNSKTRLGTRRTLWKEGLNWKPLLRKRGERPRTLMPTLKFPTIKKNKEPIPR